MFTQNIVAMLNKELDRGITTLFMWILELVGLVLSHLLGGGTPGSTWLRATWRRRDIQQAIDLTVDQWMYNITLMKSTKPPTVCRDESGSIMEPWQSEWKVYSA